MSELQGLRYWKMDDSFLECTPRRMERDRLNEGIPLYSVGVKHAMMQNYFEQRCIDDSRNDERMEFNLDRFIDKISSKFRLRLTR